MVTGTRQALLLALAALLLGLLPTWYAGREIIGGLYSDRFALPAMVGGSVLFVALAEWLLAQRWQKTLLLSLLVGLAVGAHLRVGNLYRQDWEKQTRFYWQMLWRAPGLQPGTSIISDGSIFGFVTEYSSAAAINTLYPQAPSLSAKAIGSLRFSVASIRILRALLRDKHWITVCAHSISAETAWTAS